MCVNLNFTGEPKCQVAFLHHLLIPALGNFWARVSSLPFKKFLRKMTIKSKINCDLKRRFAWFFFNLTHHFACKIQSDT